MKKRKIIIVLLFLALIIVVFLCFRFSRNNRNTDFTGAPKAGILNASEVTEEMAHNPDLAINMDLVNEKYVDVPSDIEGMTQYDKVQKGLSPYDGSDSDYDGLTDKEEIEIYHSDPLKTSTAGDLYCDGYKVANGLDLNKFYEDGKVIFDETIPVEFNLHARYASDNTATIAKVKIHDELVYRIFILSQFAGDGFDYDLTALKEETGVEYDEFAVYIKDAHTDEDIDCEYKLEDNILKVSCDFTKPNGYRIFITKKSAIPSKFSKLIFGDEISEEFNRLMNENAFEIYMGYHRDAEEGLVVVPLPLLATFGGDESFEICRPRIYYNEVEDNEQNTRLVTKLLGEAQWITSNRDVKTILKPTNIVDIVNRYNRLESIGNGFFNGTHDDVTHNFFLDYMLLSEFEGIHPVEQKAPKKFDGEVEDFDIVTGTLPFRNFATSIGVGGNCTGISTLIAKINNTGSNPSTGKSEYSNLEWDISVDDENKTLTDAILNDYKDADFVKNHMGLDGRVSTNLSDGEKEFLKMIGTYLVDGNIKIQRNCPVIEKENRYVQYSFDKLREAVRNNLDHKVLTLSMYDNDSGHTVNVYGYVDEFDAGGDFYLKVYDNNFPGEESKDLRVYIYFNERKTFDYDYRVDVGEGRDYGYSSYRDNYMFVLMDEDQNIVFGSKDDLDDIPVPLDVSKSKSDRMIEEFLKED